MSIFDNKVINFEEEPFFLGSGRNVSRLDLANEEWLDKQTARQLGKMWFKNDFSYLEDGKNFSTMSADRQWFFLENLNLQTGVDSIATRTAVEVFMPITTQPKGEKWWVVHGFFESIHSDTYAEIIKALPINAKKKFDEIMINQDILDRIKLIVDCFNDTHTWNSKYMLQTNDYDINKHKKSIVLSMYAFNILESYMFQTSFTCTFAFPENNVMESSGKAVGKIKGDEDLHVGVSQHLINRHRKLPDWAFAFEEQSDIINEMYVLSRETDKMWIEHLYTRDPKLKGLNKNVLLEYSEYMFYKTTRSIGLDIECDNVTKNPCSWGNKYSKLENNQNANNESDGSAYLLGVIDKHMTNDDWEKLEL